MKLNRFLTIVSACVATASLLTSAPRNVRAEEKGLAQTFEELLPGMGAEKGFEGPQQQWQETCFKLGAPGNEAERTAACKLMAGKLVPQTPARARVWLLQQLQRIGHEECVEAVAAAVDDQDLLVRDAAVRALANNPAKQARDALVGKLVATKDSRLKITLLGAIAYHASHPPCQFTINELTNPDPTVVAAAAQYFGKRTGKREVNTSDPMIGVLISVRAKAEGEVRFRLGDALLACADQLLKDGKVQDAMAIYGRLNAPQEPRSLRMAALKGLLNASGDQAPTLILKALAGDDADARQVAMGHVGQLSKSALDTLAAAAPTLPPAGQVALLKTLAWRRDKAVLPAVVFFTNSADEKVKIAALRALGGVGDASVVPLLVETLLKGGEPAGAARESLESLFADGADQKLVEIVQGTKDLGPRGLLIEILDRRSAEAAVPALLQEAQHDNPDIRRRAMAALGRLASAKDVAGMVRAMAKITDRGEREEAERAVVAVCGRIPDETQQAEPVLAVFAAAGDAEKPALLPILGRIGGPKSLELVRAALASGDAARYDSGFRAICNWPDASVSEDLLKLSQGAKDADDRVRALRAFVRVIALPSDRPAEQKLALLKQAMPLAGRDEERRLIIERAAALRSVETLRFVAPCLDQAELAQDACRTIVELAHHRELREPNQAEFDKALDRVIQVCKDINLVERAKSYKAAK